MPLFHHHKEGNNMSEPTTETAPLTDTGTPIHSAMTTIPVTDPNDQPAPPAAPLSADAQAQQFALFQKWQAEQAEAAGAITAGTPETVAHSFPSTVAVPDNTESTTLKSGIQLYAQDGKTYAVKPNGSTVFVDGDVYTDAVAIATLFDL